MLSLQNISKRFDGKPALSALSLFFDLAVGLAGPLMGLIASGWGYAEVFLVSGLLGIAGFLLVMQLRRTAQRSSA